MAANTTPVIPSGSYPFAIDDILNETHYITIENDYRLTVGIRKNIENKNEIYAIMKTGINNETIPNGEKANIKTYKKGGTPSASWVINVNNYSPNSVGDAVEGTTRTMSIYLFLSKTRSYISNSNTLPPEYLDSFDDAEVDVSAELFPNESNVYNMIMESGALFDPQKTYRKFALVRSAINGELYRRSNVTTLPGSIVNIDPALDTKFLNWKPVVSQIEVEEELLEKFIAKDRENEITGRLTFHTPPLKSSETQDPAEFELICRQEGERLYLKRGEIASNSNLLRNYPPSSVGGIDAITAESKNGVVANGLVVVTDKNGKIDQSFLDARIINSESVITVDKSNYNNRTSFPSVQAAYDAALKMIRLSPILIKINDGEYTIEENNKAILTANKILDSGMISIIGNETRPENVKFKIKSANDGIIYAGKGLFINGITIEQLETDKGESVGINVGYGSSLTLGHAINIYNCLSGLNVMDMSYVDAENINICNCETAVISKSSVVNAPSSKFIANKVGVLAIYNSTVNVKGSQFKKDTLNSTKTIGIISEYNSVVNATETENISDVDNMFNNHTSSTPNDTGGIIISEIKYPGYI